MEVERKMTLVTTRKIRKYCARKTARGERIFATLYSQEQVCCLSMCAKKNILMPTREFGKLSKFPQQKLSLSRRRLQPHHGSQMGHKDKHSLCFSRKWRFVMGNKLGKGTLYCTAARPIIVPFLHSPAKRGSCYSSFPDNCTRFAEIIPCVRFKYRIHCIS